MHKQTEQVTNNLSLLPVSRPTTLGSNYWQTIVNWLCDVSKMFKLRTVTYINAIALFCDTVSNPKLTSRENLQLYGMVCLDVSAQIVEVYAPEISDYIYISDNGYTEDQFIEARNVVTRESNGMLRYITPLDIMYQIFYDTDESIVDANNILIMCYISSSKYVSIRSDQMAYACMRCVYYTKRKDFRGAIPLVKDIYNTVKAVISNPKFTSLKHKQFKSTIDLFNEAKSRVTGVVSPMSSPSRQRYIPTTEYEPVYELGEGSFGQVILGSRLGESVAIKRQDIENYYTIIKELVVLSTYKHQNIIGFSGFTLYHDSVEIETQPGVSLESLVFENDNKSNLWEDVYIYNTLLPPVLHDRYTLMDDIVSGVKYLHSVGILHLDLKLANVIVRVEGNRRIAKLIDFGLSEFMVLTKNDTSHRMSEVMTINYRPPELLLFDVDQDADIIKKRREEYEGYTFGPDIWSVGVMLLEMETGVIAFPLYNAKYKTEVLADGTKFKYPLIADEVLLHITRLLGTPDNIADYPYNFPGTGLSVVTNTSSRNRILNMLQYDPKLRVLQ